MRCGTTAIDVTLPIACSFAAGGVHPLRIVFTEEGDLLHIHAPCMRERDAASAANRMEAPTCAEIAEYVRTAIKQTDPAGMSEAIRSIPILVSRTTLRGIYEEALRAMISRAIDVRMQRVTSTPFRYLSLPISELVDRDTDGLAYRRAHTLNKSIERVFSKNIVEYIFVECDSRETHVCAHDIRNGGHPHHFAYLVGKRFEFHDPLDSALAATARGALITPTGYCIPCEAPQTTISRHVKSEKHRRNVASLCKRIVAHLNKRMEVHSG